MQRKYELIDVVAAIGVFATIIGGGLFFMASNGTVSFSRPGDYASEKLPGRGDGLQWLQPVLGQAILDQTLLERHHAKAASTAEIRLHGVTGEHLRWQNSPFGYLDSIKLAAAWTESDHATRVQAVMGRSIVNFTSRGIRNDILSSEGDIADFNIRMIGAADALGQRMNAQFVVNQQPNLGRAIVAASRVHETSAGVRQERLGAAIVQATSVRTAYERTRAAIQEQLGGAMVVAMQTESQEAVPRQDYSVPIPAVMVGAQQSWPDLPMSTMVVASVILMGLFAAGLLVSPALPPSGVVEMVKLGPSTLAYPETA